MSLVALDSFHLLLSTQLTATLTPKWSGGSMFHLLSHIYAKIPFCCVETVANNALNCWRVVVFVFVLWASMVPTLNAAFSLTNVHVKWWIHCLLISQLLCYLTQLQFMIGQNEFWSFLVFSAITTEFGRPEHSASFEYIQLRFKSAYLLLTVVSDGAEFK